MARPKNDENRDRRITIRLTETEYKILAEESGRQSLTLADYVRHRALFGKIDVHYDIKAGSEEIGQIRNELHHIGINLNQIARFFNTGGKAGEAIIMDVKDSIADIHSLSEKLKKFVEDV